MKKHPTHARTQILRNLTLLATILLTVSCKKIPKEVEITHQRELCKFDENEALRGAVNRFKAKQPIHWRRVAETKDRILNYRVGKQTEVAVGSFTGSLSANVIRWYRQYGQTIEEPILDKLKQGTMLRGATYYVVDVQGKFETSMGGMAMKRENWSTIGIICVLSDKELITIKMTGPASETAKEKQNLIKFAEDLVFISYPEDNQ